jgi:hypothetical protein
MKIDYRKTAKKLKDLGISVVPLRTDGSKLPAIKWSIYQDRIMADFEIEEYFKACGGVAAITGKVSRLYCLDFDLKYQLKTQDYWKKFMEKLPKHIKGKFLINETKNNGKHIWIRTDYEYKSTHLTRRASTIPELMSRYDEMMANDKIPADKRTPEIISERILQNPYEVVIETRSRGSYAVIAHPEYKRFYGKQICEFSLDEVELINNVAYSLDYLYQPKPVFTGEAQDFGTIRKFNENGSGAKTLAMLESTGMFTYVDTERTGNIKVLRMGSKSGYSGRIYADTGVFHVFSPNTLFSTAEKSSFGPFEIYCITQNLTQEEAVKKLSSS